MSQCNPTLQEVVELAHHVRLSGASPTGLTWKARSGKGRANKREGEVAGVQKQPGVFKFLLNGRQWYCSAAVRALQTLEVSRAD